MSPGNTRKVSGGRITIPPAMMAQVGMKEGSIVEISVSGNQLVLRAVGYEEPVRRERE